MRPVLFPVSPLKAIRDLITSCHRSLTTEADDRILDILDELLDWLEAALTARPAPQPVDGNTSDGFHTFNELYDYRKAFNALLFNAWAEGHRYDVHKSWRHSDGELCFGGGWFIVVAETPEGQISNHYPTNDWSLFQLPERERSNPYDGHTPQVALQRMLKLAAASPPPAEDGLSAVDRADLLAWRQWQAEQSAQKEDDASRVVGPSLLEGSDLPQRAPEVASTPVKNDEAFVAEIIAIVAHFGQTTKSEGMVYITHPAAVAARVADEYKALAWLHDVLEDCPWLTEGHLLAAGIDSATLTALRLLTRDDKREAYAEYIERITSSGNVAALTVKLADLKHNLRPSCPPSLRARYEPAVLRIEEALTLARKAAAVDRESEASTDRPRAPASSSLSAPIAVASPAPPDPPEGWHPIATVPQDRRWVLVWCEDVGYSIYRFGSGLHASEEPQPTHWRPLPDPPEEAPPQT